jgi:flagellar biogenesis protein FliO
MGSLNSCAPVSGGKRKHLVGLGIIGLVAVTAGLVLPQLMPAAPASAKIAPANSRTNPNDLTYNPPALPEGPSARAMLLRLGLGTAVVLGLAVGTIWVSKRWLSGPPAAPGGTAHLRLVESLPLGNRCCVHLLHVAGRAVLVGMDGSGLKELLPLPESFAGALGDAQGAGVDPASGDGELLSS